MPVELLLATVTLSLVFIAAALFFVWRSKVRVPAGGAIVIYRTGREPVVSFGDALVLPIVARAETIDCAARTVVVVRAGRDALRCADNIKVDVHAEFRVAVNPTAEDVLTVVRSVGARASDPVVLRELFEAKLADAIATVVRVMRFDELTRMREELRDRVIQIASDDLRGWVVQDLVFGRIEQVPLEQLDPNNLLDAQAITLIQERLAVEQRRTHELKLEMAREEARQKVAERELMHEAERFGR